MLFDYRILRKGNTVEMAGGDINGLDVLCYFVQKIVSALKVINKVTRVEHFINQILLSPCHSGCSAADSANSDTCKNKKNILKF